MPGLLRRDGRQHVAVDRPAHDRSRPRQWHDRTAALVTTRLPAGTSTGEVVASFFDGERITYAVLAIVVGLVTAPSALTLTDSHATEEPG